MKWYKTLTIHQRINLKQWCHLITGIPFKTLSMVFGFDGAVELIYNKMKMEGFNV